MSATQNNQQPDDHRQQQQQQQMVNSRLVQPTQLNMFDYRPDPQFNQTTPALPTAINYSALLGNNTMMEASDEDSSVQQDEQDNHILVDQSEEDDQGHSDDFESSKHSHSSRSKRIDCYDTSNSKNIGKGFARQDANQQSKPQGYNEQQNTLPPKITFNYGQMGSKLQYFQLER